MKLCLFCFLQSSLEHLMEILSRTTPHYIRCIKPNADCKAMTFRREEVTLPKLSPGLCWVSQDLESLAKLFSQHILKQLFVL